MNLEVALAIVAPNLSQTGNTKVVLIKDDEGRLRLPGKSIISNSTCQEAASELLIEYTNIDINKWRALRLVQSGLFDNPTRYKMTRIVTAGYGVMIPETTPLLKGDWFTISQINEHRPLHSDHLDILLHVARYL